MHHLKETGTPCTPGRESGLSGSGKEGPRSRPVSLSCLTQTPSPLQPICAPGHGGAPPPRSRRVRERASQFRPAHRRTTARARRARRPSPFKAHYLTVPTPISRRPLHGFARAGAPGAEGPAPGRRPLSRGCLLPAGYSTWVRVTGRHEAGSEHCPSAAILPGDRALPSSQWGARGAVVLTYHAEKAPRIQSEADTGSGAAIQRAGRMVGPSGESESGAPRNL